ELRRFSKERVTDPDPVRQRTIREVDVAPLTGEGVGPEVRIANIEAGLATVADHRVEPGHSFAVVLPGAVVLRATLELVAVEWAHGKALELQAGNALVDAGQGCRNSREHLLATCEFHGTQRRAVGFT